MDRAEAELQGPASTQRRREKEKAERQAELDEIRERRKSLLPELIKLRDMARDGRLVMLPLVNRPIPLVADEWAKPELGTGCVKITPAHDPNDYDVALRQNLPMINILNLDGTLNDNAGPYCGQTVMVARGNVVADLEKLGLVSKIEDRSIDLAHSDRSKTPIEPLLTDQWFVKMDRLAQTAMDAVTSGRVKIIPERYAKGYLDWLGEKRDWPISRQLWWGPPDSDLVLQDRQRKGTPGRVRRAQGRPVAGRRAIRRLADLFAGGPISLRTPSPATRSHASETSWTPGSVPPFGLTPPWVGPTRRRSLPITTPPAC